MSRRDTPQAHKPEPSEPIVPTWAVVLAGGQGRRLQSLTRKLTGRPIPKQFCPVIGEDTLLDQTLARVRLVAPDERTLIVVTQGHEEFYAPLIATRGANRMVVQPQDRGTAAAIAYALFRIRDVAPGAVVAIFPSDHFVGDDRRLMAFVTMAAETAQRAPSTALLLGITPSGPERGLGWIEPGTPLAVGAAPAFAVGGFWEKPSEEMAAQLLARGCLWNSFIIVARLEALLSLMMYTLPRLYLSFEAIRPVLGSGVEADVIQRVYADIERNSFSTEVLAACPSRLGVVPVTGLEWSDLGEPHRVAEVLRGLDRPGAPRAAGPAAATDRRGSLRRLRQPQ